MLPAQCVACVTASHNLKQKKGNNVYRGFCLHEENYRGGIEVSVEITCVEENKWSQKNRTSRKRERKSGEEGSRRGMITVGVTMS